MIPSSPVFIRVVASLLVCASTTLSIRAHAEGEKDVCISAYEMSQRLRNDGKLLASREKLLVCARDVCPAIARTACADWLSEVEKNIPTIVVAAHDETGRETDGVKVSVDGAVVSEQLDGRPIRIDPGSHSIRFELRSGKAYEERLVITEGEKNRKVSADFVAVVPKTAPTPDKMTSPQAAEPGLPTSVFILGGVAAVGLVSFTGFAVSGKSTEGCAPSCSASQVTSLRRAYLLADVSLGVALVSAGAALYIALTSRGQAPPPKAPPVALDWRPLVGGGAITASAAF